MGGGRQGDATLLLPHNNSEDPHMITSRHVIGTAPFCAETHQFYAVPALGKNFYAASSLKQANYF
jgi:hypothetical protein